MACVTFHSIPIMGHHGSEVGDQALRGKAPATKTSGQQKLLFRAPADPESADPESVEPKSRKSTKSVATPCRRNDVSTPKSASLRR